MIKVQLACTMFEFKMNSLLLIEGFHERVVEPTHTVQLAYDETAEEFEGGF